MKYVSLVTLLVAVSAAGACTRAAEHTTAPPQSASASAPPLPVATTQVAVRQLPSAFETGGIVRARLTAVVASRVMAPITAIHVSAGDRVRRGQPLVELDAREWRANLDRAEASSAGAEQSVAAADAGVAAARASLVLARATHQRMADLAAKKSATTQELDQAVAALAGAEAQVRAAEAQHAAAQSGRLAADAARAATTAALSYAQLVAPFDGLVSQRLMDPGTMAIPGAPVLVLEDTTRIRVEAMLDESRAAQIGVGATVEVALDAAAAAWQPTRVAEIARVDPASHSFVVKMDLPDGVAVRTGTFARVRVAGPARTVLAVPASAIVRRGQLAFVFVVSKELAHLRAVSTAAGQGTDVEILAGLVEGETLVTNPPPALADGRRVQIVATPVPGAGR